MSPFSLPFWCSGRKLYDIFSSVDKPVSSLHLLKIKKRKLRNSFLLLFFLSTASFLSAPLSLFRLYPSFGRSRLQTHW
ncbi:hypothetical protein PORCAN_607 [Porphyromonas crevioricanis JCM 13913]|nr:hypothetical protein PORCAN_607 [Porphyromonas crevioricanis JCM 13913]